MFLARHVPDWRRQLEGRAERIERALPRYEMLWHGLKHSQLGNDPRLRDLARALADEEAAVAEALAAVDTARARGRVPSEASIVRDQAALAGLRESLVRHVSGASATPDDLAAALARVSQGRLAVTTTVRVGSPVNWVRPLVVALALGTGVGLLLAGPWFFRLYFAASRPQPPQSPPSPGTANSPFVDRLIPAVP